MAPNNRLFFPLSIAGALCCAALIGVSPPHADGEANLTLPGLQDQPFTPESSFTRMFPSLPPFAQQTDEVRERVKQLGAKDGLIDAMDNLTDAMRETPGTMKMSLSASSTSRSCVFTTR